VDSMDQVFVATVSAFYGDLLAHQEMLDAEFERVLNDNLWELICASSQVEKEKCCRERGLVTEVENGRKF